MRASPLCWRGTIAQRSRSEKIFFGASRFVQIELRCFASPIVVSSAAPDKSQYDYIGIYPTCPDLSPDFVKR